MALQNSGTITAANIRDEFGGSNPMNLNDYYRGGSLVPDTPTNSGVPTSGTISYADFYGASATPALQFFLSAFGSNANGRTGLGTTSGDELFPVAVGSSSGWTDISTRVSHSLGVDNGRLYSWGDNTDGRTGLGITSGNTTTPTQIGSLTTWRKVAAGSNHSLATRDGPNGPGTVLLTFGANTNGQLGSGATTPSSTPNQVASTLSEYVSISAGFNWSAAVRASGELVTCGTNENGRTAQGTTVGNTFSFAFASTPHIDWLMVACGSDHGHAIRQNGTLWSWGRAFGGRLGTGIPASSPGNQVTPAQVGSATNWFHVTAGNGFGLGLRGSGGTGTLWAWGDNANGRTGLGTTSGSTISPVQVGSFSDWVFVDAGNNHALGIRSNGWVYAWGNNTNGRTGQNTTFGNITTPSRIGSLTGGLSAAAGFTHSLVLNDGTPVAPPTQLEILPGLIFVSTSAGTPPATAGVNFNNNGTITSVGFGANLSPNPANWFGPTTAGIGSDYQIRAQYDTAVAGSNAGITPSWGSWLDLDFGVTWQLTISTVGFETANGAIQIREKSSGTIVGEAQVTLQVDVS